MTAPPGWYADPSGQPRTLRYWDGLTWTESTMPQPGLATPAGSPLAPATPPGPPRRSLTGWLIGAGALLAVIALVAVLVVRGLTGGSILGEPSPRPSSGSDQVCPQAQQPTASVPSSTDGRVVSGRLSYPRLAEPFGDPYWDSRVPFGRDIQGQQATVEADAKGTPTWVAAVLVARLLAGDGFYGPQQGAEVVADCIIGRFYGNTPVTRTDRRTEAITVDGHDAYLIESHLTFKLPDIATTGETMLIVVVDVADGEGGLFYASIPDSSPQFLRPARDAQAGLLVAD